MEREGRRMIRGSAMFYIVAGEASGDRHGAELLRELKKSYPESSFTGVGGRHLRNAGQEQLFDLAEHAVVGLTDVLLNYFKFKRFFERVLADMRAKEPEVLILIDFPGFNLRLLERVKAELPNTKVVYYISPQVWAWKAGRAKKMAQQIDLLLVIFPFEKDWFAEKTPGFRVEWVGHPILDRWDVDRAVTPWRELPQRVLLLPGSRRKEITAHMPVFVETARQLAGYFSGLSFVILAADADAERLIQKEIQKAGAEHLGMEIRSGYQLTHLSRARLALVASGTATLECALAGVPMLVVYKTNPITYWIGRRLVKLEFLSIVNLIAGKKVVPEFLQSKARPEYLVEAAKLLLESEEASEGMRGNLGTVVGKLGKAGANQEAVVKIREFLISHL
ncbi:MAG: lipid-A-disaccharide synthase [Blastochloris sp.]|nr:lipid-A-disaccharide synthase [Blastochloris sp.]